MKVKFNFRFLMTMLLGIFATLDVLAQNITAKGTVKDAMGEPIMSATVVQVGTGNGVVTDLDGNFTLSVPQGATLKFSFIGYKAQELPAAETMNVVLQEDSELLDDVLVIGYGTVKKNDLTGAMTAIKPDELTKGVTTSTQDMLVGKAPGVSVIGDGTPGGSATIRVRGGASLNASNNPLYVIDGLAIDGNQSKGQSNLLALVNPNDIESMTILKDASATAIYGSRASNGVIIITTKKGRKNMKPQVAYNISGTVSTPRKMFDVLSGDEYRDYVKSVAPQLADGLGKANTDWQKEIYHNALSVDHSISLAGSTRQMPYRFSAGYANQNGILKTSDSRRINLGLNLAPEFLENHLKFNVNAKYSHVKDDYADTGAIGRALEADPTQPVRNGMATTGGYWQVLSSGFDGQLPSWNSPQVNTNAVGNPVALLDLKKQVAHTNSLIGNVEVDYKIHGFEDLHIHANVGGEYGETRQNTHISPFSASNNYYGWEGYDQTYKYEMQGNIYAQYMHEFDKQAVDVMVGAEQSHNHREFHYVGSDPYEGVKRVGAAHNQEDKFENTKRIYHSSLVSYFGRLNYTLMDRYLLTATLRMDGSSRFDKDNQWGAFPSVALAWKLSEEKFLEDAEWLSDLKLRLGWGVTGQQEVPQGYEFYYLPTYKVSDPYGQYTLGNTSYSTSRPNTYNKDLSWEKTTTYNVGLDYGMYDGRITAGLDAYYRETSDLLSEVSVGAGTNFGNYVLQNIGSMVNKGIEFNVDARAIQTRNFLWQVSYNVGWNDNEITSLNTGSDQVTKEHCSYGLAGTNYVSVNKKGYPVNSFWVYQQVYDEAGKPIEGVYVDRNGDGVISDKDRYIYKKPTADVTMGLTNKFVYKKWDLSFTLRASINNYLYYDVLSTRARCNNTSYLFSNGDYHNTIAEATKLGWTGASNYQYSDYFVRNASFVRCDNINLGYSFDKLFATSDYHGLSGRLYFTCQNPFVITKYDGMDPEIDRAVDSSVYPKPTSFQLGMSLNF